MCNAMVGRIDSISGSGIERVAMLAVGEASRAVSLAMLEDVSVGDWLIFHSGYALRAVSEDEAQGTIQAIEGLLRSS